MNWDAKHDQELTALTVRLEMAEDERDEAKAESARLLASLHEEQRKHKEIQRALGADGLESFEETIARITGLLDMLQECEWTEDSGKCPICGRSRSSGHNPRCRLASALKDQP